MISKLDTAEYFDNQLLNHDPDIDYKIFADIQEHGRRVARLAVLMGKRLELKEKELATLNQSALLHDYASIKDEALYADHHIHGPIEAEKLLRCFGYPQERIEAVKACIAAHSRSVPAGPSTWMYYTASPARTAAAGTGNRRTSRSVRASNERAGSHRAAHR